MRFTIAIFIVLILLAGEADPVVAGENASNFASSGKPLMPERSQFSEFDIEILDLVLQKTLVGGDRCLMGGQFRLGEKSNGVQLLWEDLTINVGTYSLTVPAGSFNVAGTDYNWHGKIDGSVVGVLLEDQGMDHFSFAVAIGSVDLGEIPGRTRVSLAIGDDEGSFTANLTGSLHLGK